MPIRKLNNAAVICDNRSLIIVRNNQWVLPGGNAEQVKGLDDLIRYINKNLPGLEIEPLIMPKITATYIGHHRKKILVAVYPFKMVRMPDSEEQEKCIEYAQATGSEREYGFSFLMKNIFEQLHDKRYLVRSELKPEQHRNL